ncbi:hypothetical protein NQ176_g4009 [Zarea fungicola]|uniref:Uncharacterized protein n=1 Tax=Zarea fungicola TaxID=93591 RepID=A0ACC1NGW4_9HYPO|nr:hypothetical protein NQ176_g4009 [Lecanicillium fungicola]
MFSRRWGLSDRDFMDVWNENFWITTSGMFDLPSLECCLKVCSEDRILYSLDYPFEDPKEGADFMVEVERSGLVSPEQFEMICSGNAKKLLRI